MSAVTAIFVRTTLASWGWRRTAVTIWEEMMVIFAAVPLALLALGGRLSTLSRR